MAQLTMLGLGISYLPGAYFASMLDQFAGSSLGRQELDGEMLEEADGALWNPALLDRCSSLT